VVTGVKYLSRSNRNPLVALVKTHVCTGEWGMPELRYRHTGVLDNCCFRRETKETKEIDIRILVCT